MKLHNNNYHLAIARSFDLSFRYRDQILSLNNPRFHKFIHHVYPKELEIKDTSTTDACIVKSASYLELHIYMCTLRDQWKRKTTDQTI